VVARPRRAYHLLAALTAPNPHCGHIGATSPVCTGAPPPPPPPDGGTAYTCAPGTPVGIGHNASAAAFPIPGNSGTVCGQVQPGVDDFVSATLIQTARHFSVHWTGNVNVQATVNGSPADPRNEPYTPGGLYVFEVQSGTGQPEPYTVTFIQQ
jgi:hypothetical protein